MSWINTQTDKDVKERVSQFWNKMRSDLKNERFWADKIKEFKEEPAKRLALAMENLPLPAAFREAAVALRTLIRQKKKDKEDYIDELTLLYWFAAINSFSIPYSNYLKQPGYNVFESIPGNVIKTLEFSYLDLGYEHLELLNKTDVKLLVELWGEPKKHTTLHKIHKDIWSQYEKALLLKQQNDQRKLFF